jgi:predicted nucleic acid-binding protein
MKGVAIKRLVLDASIAVSWCFSNEHSRLAESILDLLAAGTEMLAPAIWPFEVANALLAGERRKRISPAQVTALLQRISKLPIVIEPIDSARAFEQVLAVARQHELTEYDAAYLELALREGLPLATLDMKLRQVAQSAGVALVE